MNDALRALSLGAVSLFGVAVPGFLLLFLATVGLLLPGTALALHLSGTHWDVVGELLTSHGLLLVAVALVFSYVAGYILRLSSPDELDQKSAVHVLDRMNPKDKEDWPTTREEADRFPYFRFKEYLQVRGLHDLAHHVQWGRDEEEGEEEAKGEEGAGEGEENVRGKRSKSAINRMKLEITLGKPELAATVESNEAHIRLMSGTWLAIGTTSYAIVAGGALAACGLLLVHSPGLRLELDLSASVFPTTAAPPYELLLAINAFLLICGLWARARIKSLFHYRRVGELLYIVMAYDEARKSRGAGPEAKAD